MCGPDAGKAFGLGLYHRAEVISSQSPLLLQVGSDGLQLFVGQGFVQELVVGSGSGFRRCGKGGVFPVRRKEGVLAKAAMIGAA